MIIRIWILFICILIINLFLTASIIHAVDVNITSYPVSQENFEFELKVLIKGAKKATNYLRINTGETWNGSGWYSGGDFKSYLPVKIDSKEVETNIRGRVLSSGEYDIKILRYTQSGNLAQDNSNSVKINFVKRIETTPIATNITTITPTVLPTAIVTENPTLIPAVLSDLSEKIEENNIVATDRPHELNNTLPPVMEINSKTNSNLLSYFFVFIGVALIIFSAIVIIVKVYNEYYARKS